MAAYHWQDHNQGQQFCLYDADGNSLVDITRSAGGGWYWWVASEVRDLPHHAPTLGQAMSESVKLLHDLDYDAGEGSGVIAWLVILVLVAGIAVMAWVASL